MALEILDEINQAALSLERTEHLEKLPALHRATTLKIIELTAICQKAEKAIGRMLKRIKEVDQVQYHVGAGTQTYSDLCVAYSKLSGMPENEVAEKIIPGSSGLVSDCE